MECPPGQADAAAAIGKVVTENGPIFTILRPHTDAAHAVLHSGSALACVYMVYYS